MASSLASSNSAPNPSSYEKPISKNLALSPFSISFPLHKTRLCAIKTSSDGGDAVRSSEDTTAHGADLLRKPTASTPAVDDNEESDSNGGDGGTWMDWEDMILEETVPLVGFV